MRTYKHYTRIYANGQLARVLDAIQVMHHVRTVAPNLTYVANALTKTAK